MGAGAHNMVTDHTKPRFGPSVGRPGGSQVWWLPRPYVSKCQPRREAAAGLWAAGSSPDTGQPGFRHGCHEICPGSQSPPRYPPLSPIWVLSARAPETIFRSITEESGAMLDDRRESTVVGPKRQPPAHRQSCGGGMGGVALHLTSLVMAPTHLTILDAPDHSKRAAYCSHALESWTSPGRQPGGREEYGFSFWRSRERS
jgi:hypothetical protein